MRIELSECIIKFMQIKKQVFKLNSKKNKSIYILQTIKLAVKVKEKIVELDYKTLIIKKLARTENCLKTNIFPICCLIQR